MAMTLRERIQTYTWNLTPEAPLCINCRHFHQHYVQSWQQPGRCEPIASGHCVYPRVKPRYAYDTCEHFKNKNTQ